MKKELLNPFVPQAHPAIIRACSTSRSTEVGIVEKRRLAKQKGGFPEQEGEHVAL